MPVRLEMGVDVASLNVDISYNPAVAAADGEATPGYLVDNALLTSNAKEAGTIRLAFSRAAGVGGSGPVAYLPFKATGKPGDRTALHLVVTGVYGTAGGKPPIATVDGEILIVDKSGVLQGDCDGDGVLTEADAWCALQMSVKNVPERLTTDMDGDGQVNARDATLILQRASKPTP